MFVIITQPEQVRGWRFDRYIKAPDYKSLEDIVKGCVM